jgi:hypothetical protein
MFRTSRTIFALACACALVATCLAATNSWNGAWKMNSEKSSFKGSTVTIHDDGGGKMTYASGSFSWSFTCDGKDYNTIKDRVGNCKLDNPDGSSYTTVSKTPAGTVLSASHHKISADGKTESVTVDGTRADGSKYAITETYAREGAGKGMAGVWKEIKEVNSNPAPITLAVKGDVLHYEQPQNKSMFDAKLDGTPTAYTGANLPQGLTVEIKAEGANKLNATFKMDGKPYNQQVWTLSADGKTITEVTWSPDKPMEKATVVLDKM